MPNVFKKWINGYRFFFYSNESDEPIHVHVSKAANAAKFWMNPVELAKNNGFTPKEIAFIKKLIKARKTRIIKAWNEHFTI